MAQSDTTGRAGGPSDEAVRKATGRSAEEWFALMDGAGAAEWSHKEIVAWLARGHAESVSSWLQQSLTVAYEKARGKRVLGETAETGFQIGVSRTVALPAEALWALLVSSPELWLGEGAALRFEPGERYIVPRGEGSPEVVGEVRMVKAPQRLRMTWHPEGWERAATLQLALTEKASGKTSITAQMEKLPDPEAREAMRERWQGALARIVAQATERDIEIINERAAFLNDETTDALNSQVGLFGDR